MRTRKDKVNQKNKDYSVSFRTAEAAESVRSLIHSLSIPLEEKITMEDQINELSHESNCLMDIMSNSEKAYQKKLFFAYREFLERNIDAVNQRISEA